MSAHNPHHEDDDMLDEAEAGEEIQDDGDAPMESDEEEDEGQDINIHEIQLQNDSIAHFDAHRDSIFCIAQHPVHPQIIATGGGAPEGEDIGEGFIFDATPVESAANGQSNGQPVERESLKQLFKLEGHTDSINAITFTFPKGQYIVTAGLDGKLRTWQGEPAGKRWKFLAEAQEVEEINWLSPCPDPEHPNVVALGASDGSVWVYQINVQDKQNPLAVLQAFYLHTEACTAGAWTPDGKLLTTVSEDSSFYVWDVFGDAAAAGLSNAQGGGQNVVGLTGLDERFRVEGGLYSVAVAPNGAFAAVGGPEGNIRIVGLPRIAQAGPTAGSSGAGARGKTGGGKQAGGPSGTGQAGQILASLEAGSDNVETISFSSAPLTLMAAGNVDGSITLFDTAHRFTKRRSIPGAHADDEMEHAVVKIEFVKVEGPGGWLLTSCGLDGAVRRWDMRGGTAAAAKGLIGEWKGHRGGGEGGGVMGFVQGDGKAVVTAGDDGISLEFSTPV